MHGVLSISISVLQCATVSEGVNSMIIENNATSSLRSWKDYYTGYCGRRAIDMKIGGGVARRMETSLFGTFPRGFAARESPSRLRPSRVAAALPPKQYPGIIIPPATQAMHQKHYP